MADQCEVIYDREYEPGMFTQVRCTFVNGHPGEYHSFRTLRLQDEIDKAEAEVQAKREAGIGCDDDTPSDVRALLANITAGKADPYLEAILAVAHNRKRALRGTRGFGRL